MSRKVLSGTPAAAQSSARYTGACPTCEHAEYACTYAHGGDEKSHEGLDHKEGEGNDD
jgi:hypothetical protein